MLNTMLSNDNTPWTRRTLRRPGRPLVEWLHLGAIGDPKVTVGVLKDGSWVVDTADGLANLNDDNALTLAFPIFNASIHDFHEQLRELQGGFEDVNWQGFPLSRLVVHAISSGGYWAERSLPWMSEIVLDDCAYAAAIVGLKAIENNKEFSKELRHKARRHRRQLEQSSR